MIKIYFNWLLINVGFCLLPLVISIPIGDGITYSIISSFVAYLFTLLITSLYIYDRDGESESTLKWTGFLLAFLLLATYIFYPNLASPRQMKWIENRLYVLLGGVLILTLIMSFLMNLKSMNLIAHEKEEAKIFKKAKKTGSKMEGMIEQMKNKKNG